mgnify:CR=1 FL=1
MSHDKIYSEVLLDHNRHPRHSGELTNPDISMDGANPMCGDEITMYASVEDGTLVDVAFRSTACAICTASASMFCEMAKGKHIDHIHQHDQLMRKLMHGEKLEHDERRALADMNSLEGVSKLPVRVKCAMLVWETWELMKQKLKEINKV